MQTQGMCKLSEHLKQAGLPQSAFAEAIGVSRGHMSALISGARLPSLELAVRIERLTGGAVPASSWVPLANADPTPGFRIEGAA
ncbi:helix-turn-helix transcriptional regulator [Rhodobacter sp. JA431]|uniref:helix-turn-helix transcriptional regulator n=1 Tax=Rhodobacter sp. JA431 TaxID=570013 RepID=UPI000BE2FD96